MCTNANRECNHLKSVASRFSGEFFVVFLCMQEIIKLEIQISCVTSEWMHIKLDYCATLHSFSISPLLSLCHALKHISPPTPQPPPMRRTGDRARACVQMNQRCLLYCFRLEPFRVAYLRELQIMFSKLTLIISDPGERRALSLHTIKATELP